MVLVSLQRAVSTLFTHDKLHECTDTVAAHAQHVIALNFGKSLALKTPRELCPSTSTWNMAECSAETSSHDTAFMHMGLLRAEVLAKLRKRWAAVGIMLM